MFIKCVQREDGYVQVYTDNMIYFLEEDTYEYDEEPDDEYGYYDIRLFDLSAVYHKKSNTLYYWNCFSKIEDTRIPGVKFIKLTGEVFKTLSLENGLSINYNIGYEELFKLIDNKETRENIVKTLSIEEIRARAEQYDLEQGVSKAINNKAPKKAIKI